MSRQQRLLSMAHGTPRVCSPCAIVQITTVRLYDCTARSHDALSTIAADMHRAFEHSPSDAYTSGTEKFPQSALVRAYTIQQQRRAEEDEGEEEEDGRPLRSSRNYAVSVRGEEEEDASPKHRRSVSFRVDSPFAPFAGEEEDEEETISEQVAHRRVAKRGSMITCNSGIRMRSLSQAIRPSASARAQVLIVLPMIKSLMNT